MLTSKEQAGCVSCDSQHAVPLLCSQLGLSFATRSRSTWNHALCLLFLFASFLLNLRCNLLEHVLHFCQACDEVVLRFLRSLQSPSVTFRIWGGTGGDPCSVIKRISTCRIGSTVPHHVHSLASRASRLANCFSIFFGLLAGREGATSSRVSSAESCS